MRNPDLSDRELQVLTELANGLTYRQIAAALFLSPYTIRNHIKAVLDKLDAKNSPEAVAIAFRRGLLR